MLWFGFFLVIYVSHLPKPFERRTPIISFIKMDLSSMNLLKIQLVFPKFNCRS